mmetsp:Transcript_61817/g.123891  ORF Transcript_61817/g.123891 Transcript_61817/m.123891 type:complete len:200 (-) Transcript_61817:954-1553(-)
MKASARSWASTSLRKLAMALSRFTRSFSRLLASRRSPNTARPSTTTSPSRRTTPARQGCRRRAASSRAALCPRPSPSAPPTAPPSAAVDEKGVVLLAADPGDAKDAEEADEEEEEELADATSFLCLLASMPAEAALVRRARSFSASSCSRSKTHKQPTWAGGNLTPNVRCTCSSTTKENNRHTQNKIHSSKKCTIVKSE